MNADLPPGTLLFKAVAAAIPDPFFVFDRDGNFQAVFGGSDRTLYDDPRYLIGRNIREILPPTLADKFLEVIQRALDSGCLQVVEYPLASADCMRSPADGPRGPQWFEGRVFPMTLESGSADTAVWLALNVTVRKRAEFARENALRKLEQALSEIKTLNGIIPICACCKKIRDDTGYWNTLERYLTEHSNAQLSHGFCPDCAARMMRQLEEESPQASLFPDRA